MKYRCLLIFICLAILVGCTPVAAPDTTISPSATTPQSEDQQLYDRLFDIHNKITLRLDMPEAEIAKMQADYEKYDQNGSKSPIYRMADLYVTITAPDGKSEEYRIPQVGVRMKGNTSRTSFYSPDKGIYNVIHLKLSFQETFDDAAYYGADAVVWEESARNQRKDRTFATLEKLDLRWNRCDDSTYLKEYFAFETYRQYGVIAPRTNLASFDWAGIHMGVFTINEPVDKQFLEKNLPAAALGGDLYKCGWGGNDNGSFTGTHSIGIEDEDAGKFYAYDLKTNKKTSTHEALKNLIRTMNAGPVTKEQFAKLIDIENFLPYCAVSYLLGNPDDMRNNYNNFYVYFRADTNQAVLIPYDYDRCLGVTTHWNPTGNGVTGDNPFSLKLNADNSEQKNPLIRYSVAQGGHYVREYAALLTEVVGGEWFCYETFASIYRIASANYGNDTTPGKVFHNTSGLYQRFDLEKTSDFASHGNISIREYLDAKITTLNAYLKDLDKYADVQITVPAIWYIRADFTNWDNDNNYVMTADNGSYSIRLRATKQVRLKIYNDHTGRWYGTECVAEDCTVAYESDDHTNIVLNSGTYIISIDPMTEIVTLEKE